MSVLRKQPGWTAKWSKWSGLFLGIALSCNGTLAIIEVERTAITQIQGSGIVGELLGDVGFENFLAFDFSGSQELQNEGVEAGDVKDVRMTVFELSVLDPPNEDLHFFERIDVYVEAPGLERQRVAYQDSFPPGQSRVEFEIADIDLTDYATAPSMDLSVDVRGHPPEKATQIQARAGFDVGVTFQGACAALKSQ